MIGTLITEGYTKRYTEQASTFVENEQKEYVSKECLIKASQSETSGKLKHQSGVEVDTAITSGYNTPFKEFPLW